MDQKKEPINLMPAKPKSPMSKTLTELLTSTFQNRKLKNKLFRQSFKNQFPYQILPGTALSIF